MNITERSYAGAADLSLMSDLARRSFSENMHVTDLPYRLSSWGMDDPDNIRLWLDEGEQILGWAIMQNPFWVIDIVCSPSIERELYPRILAWADRRASQIAGTGLGLPAWFVNVFSCQKDRISALEQAGFKCQSDHGEDSWSKVLMKRSGNIPVKTFSPPEGYLVRPLAGIAEVAAYVDLHRSVFGTKNMTVDWRLNTLKNPAYRSDLDIVVQSPDGSLVAFCICWLGKDPPVGQIEPLGCHEDYRKYGLGRVALAEGLKRLCSLGVEDIYVETDNFRNTAFRLYESFDFKVIHEVLVYGKDYDKVASQSN